MPASCPSRPPTFGAGWRARTECGDRELGSAVGDVGDIHVGIDLSKLASGEGSVL
jgi:hypothetical protein